MKAFAPVNIAWIKYMGKEQGRPSNASFSMTLADLGTETSVQCLAPGEGLQFHFSEEGYMPPDPGQMKAFRFLRDLGPFCEMLALAGFAPREPGGVFRIQTRNSAPAGTGIATSASGFAALTLAWIPHFLKKESFLEFREAYSGSPALRSEVARLAARGSGSACRSFHGPFVEWRSNGEVQPFAHSTASFVDFVLLFDSGFKEVSSSEAHERVRSSPLFAGRPARAEARLGRVKEALRRGDLRTLSQAVLEEAIDMHELFHTSFPPFRYWNQESEGFRDRVLKQSGLPSPHGILTFDAGANAHLFVPEAEAPEWSRFLSAEYPALEVLWSRAGSGAGYR